LNPFERAFLAAGSAVMSVVDPYRGGKFFEFTLHMQTKEKNLDMVAAFGEVTAGPSLPRLRDRMLESKEGRRILKMRPRINSKTINLDELSTLPEGTFGRAYISWLEKCGVSPDSRTPVCIFLRSVSLLT
jgi:ubiquinone biosynthesis protein COQ4